MLDRELSYRFSELRDRPHNEKVEFLLRHLGRLADDYGLPSIAGVAFEGAACIRSLAGQLAELGGEVLGANVVYTTSSSSDDEGEGAAS